VAAKIHRSATIAECGKFTLALLSRVQLVEVMTDFNPHYCPLYQGIMALNNNNNNNNNLKIARLNAQNAPHQYIPRQMPDR
jgi:hypothetical protein